MYTYKVKKNLAGNQDNLKITYAIGNSNCVKVKNREG